MHALGRLEDLPQDYRDDLTRHNLLPLWPNLRAVLPPRVPSRQTKPVHWPYATIRPLLMRAGESLAKVTAEGKIEAGRSRAILIEEANKALAEAARRARHLRRENSRKAYFQHRRAIERQRYLASTAPAGIGPEDIAPNWRKLYAD